MLNSLKLAVRILTRFDLRAEEPEDLAGVRACFPLVGMALGLGAWLVARAFMWSAGDRIGIIVSAVAVPVLLWWLTGGKGLKGLVWSLEHRPRTDAESSYDLYWRLTAFQVSLLLKILCTGVVLCFGRSLWIVLVPLLSHAALAEAFTSPQEQQERAVRTRYGHWVSAGVVVVVLGGLMGAWLGAVFAAILSACLVAPLRRLAGIGEGQPSEPPRRAVMELVEQLVLLIGALYFLGHPTLLGC